MPAFPYALAPLLLSFVAWMLSGSPVPLAMTVALLAIASLGQLGPLARSDRRRGAPRDEGGDRILFPALLVAAAFAAATWQASLFREGIAFAFRAELAAPFHPAFALLWGAAALRLGTESARASSGAFESALGTSTFAGLSLGLWGTLSTVRYDFELWQMLSFVFLPWLLFGYFCLRLREGRTRRSAALVRLSGLAAFAAVAVALSWGGVAVEGGMHRIATALRSAPDLLPEDDEPAAAPRASGAGEGRNGSRRLARSADLHFDDRIRLFLKTESEELFESWLSAPRGRRTSAPAGMRTTTTR